VTRRLIIAAVGAFMLGNAVGLVGYSVTAQSATAYLLGEVRAVYGGLFVVIGVFTLLFRTIVSERSFDGAARREEVLVWPP
jgi:hypothetical protein